MTTSTEAILSQFLGEDINISLLLAGVNNTIYSVSAPKSNQKFVLRALTGDRVTMMPTGEDIQHIATRMKMFAATGHCCHPIALLLPEDDNNIRITSVSSNDSLNVPYDYDPNIDGTSNSSSLKHGGLLVEYIDGRHTSFPNDLPMLARGLARLHASGDSTGKRPILGDANSSNYIITPDNRAVVVDIEGESYGMPIADVSHLSLYPSILWCKPQAEPLHAKDVIDLYKCYKVEYKKLLPFGTEEEDMFNPTALHDLRIELMHWVIGWMENLVLQTEQEKITPPPDMLRRAHNIISMETREKTIANENQIKELLHKI